MKRKVVSTGMLKAFKTYLFNDEKSAATIAKYMHDVQHFAYYMGGGVVKKESVLAYKNYLAQTYAISSANSMLAAVNTFLKFAGLMDCCVKQFKIQKQVYSSSQKELTKAEYLRLVETARKKGNERLSLILQTICGTGIPASLSSLLSV